MDTRLEEAAQRRLADDFAGAQALCHAVLADQPANSQAMAILGICAIETGDLNAGSDWLDKAEAADPSNATVALYRSSEFAARGDIDKALTAANAASDLAPERFDVWGRVGDLAGQTGDFALAAMAFGRALSVSDGHPATGPVALRLAGARVETGDLAGASVALDQAESHGLGGSPDVLRLRAAMARQVGDWAAMNRFADAWVAAAPGDFEALSAQALALSQQGYYKKAANAFKTVVEAEPTAENWAAQGRLILGARDLARAEGCFRKALSIDPDCAEAEFGLARIHTFTGRLEKAEAACRRTLELAPTNLEAFGQLGEVSGGRFTDDELSQLKTLVEAGGMPADQLSIGLFALGDAFHRRKQREDAFATWQRANDTKKIQHNGAVVSAYDGDAQAQRSDWLMSAFDTDVQPEAPASREGATPIFIVGMPRSGTTLIEAAIAAHDDVLPGGELSALPFVFEDFMRWAEQSGWSGGALPEDRLEAWRERYRAQHREFGLDRAKWVTDKQPSNFLAVGLIRQLFPDAPIIHIRRKPIETSFSIFRRNFSRQWPFAHDLDDIAHYYAEHSRLCAHWDATIARRFTLIQYEDLVKNFEERLRVVMARTGLSWSQKCLQFYKQDSTVMTFSAVQVRRPPSADHLDSTTPYADQLGAFDNLMRARGVDPDTGAWGVSEPVEDGGTTGKTGFWSRLTGQGKQDRTDRS